MNGIVNVNKPLGITSHDVVYRLRRLLGIKKIGHTGTLDPNAEGVLPVCVGKSTRVSDMLMFSDKEYVATVKLGIVTDTYDIWGKIIEERQKQTYSVKKARGDYREPKIKWWEIYKLADRAFARKKIKKEVAKASKIKPFSYTTKPVLAML